MIPDNKDISTNNSIAEPLQTRPDDEIRRCSLFYSMRSRLQALTLSITMLPLLVATLGTIAVLSDHLTRDISSQLAMDIEAANLFYQNEVNEVAAAINAISLDHTVGIALESSAYYPITTHLALLSVQYDLDFLIIVDETGRCVAGPFFQTIEGKVFSDHPLISKSLTTHLKTVATHLESNKDLMDFFHHTGKKIADRQIMVLEAASPIIRDDQVMGIVLGGKLVTDDETLLGGLRNITNCDRIHIVSAGKVNSSIYRPGEKYPKNGFPFPARLDDRRIDSDTGSKQYFCPFTDKQMVYDFAPLTVAASDPPAALVCIRYMDSFDPVLAHISRLMIVIFTLSLFLATILTFFTSRSIVRPLRTLTTAMDKMLRGDIDAMVELRRNDEIGGLIQGYNRMIGVIKQRMLELNQEIKHRQNAEEQFTAESERLKVILQSIAEGVIATDIQGRVVIMNRVAEQITGWPINEAQWHYADEIFRTTSAVSLKSVIHPVHRVLSHNDQNPYKGDLLLKSRDNQKIIITESCAPLLNEKGELIGTVLVFHDVTARRKMEDEVAKAQKLESIGVLAGGIAHDFNNLLTAILGNISLIKMMSEKNDKIRYKLDDAEKATMRARDLTRQLLTFSKGGAPIKKTVSLKEIIRESADFITRGSETKISYDIKDDLWLVDADIVQFSQVVDNLVLNGIQAMKTAGEIKISGHNVELRADSSLPLPEGKYVLLTFSDNGPGIPPEIIDKIFDPYFTTKNFGNGLGLAICYAVINKHQGHLSVESEPGQGAVFSIYLPASMKQRIESETPKLLIDDSPIYGQGHILVMDDEKMLRDVAGSILESLGYSSEFAANGEDAIELYKKRM
ncbi:MAG: ATP-binding protein, partial [Desulfobulbaceae bacterium]|nr:ATP-binding protein [Desulfobulbaceae bacterium]